jgi:hypothetical protein
MLCRRYLLIISGASMAQFLRSERVTCENLKHFLLDTVQQLRWHAERMAAPTGRPFAYLSSAGLRMEQWARELAERDGITEGLLCVFSKLEPCRTFSFKYGKDAARAVSPKRRVVWSRFARARACRVWVAHRRTETCDPARRPIPRPPVDTTGLRT